MIALVQLHEADDPEGGGDFSVKERSVSTELDAESSRWRRVTTLMPPGPDSRAIVRRGELVAELVEVLLSIADEA